MENTSKTYTNKENVCVDEIMVKISQLAKKAGVQEREAFIDWVDYYVNTMQAFWYGPVNNDLCYYEIVAEWIRKYGDNVRKTWHSMNEKLAYALNEYGTDILGPLYQKLSMANKKVGQSFTPACLSQLLAALLEASDPEQRGMSIGDTCCGSGSLTIALVYEKRKHGTEDITNTYFLNDIDLQCVKMAYMQLNLMHINAVICHADTITQKVWKIFETDKKINLDFLKNNRDLDEELVLFAWDEALSLGAQELEDGIKQYCVK